ncbi:aspartate kinase [Kibdelosporangium banguiense]|uniref:Aspartokinase n=1 Tax=Kibdelosporangium banguiense TaxID=1365924 RepID=A0ABS4TX87_9PSEU|nr:aspartate kinase [Kibdelosporangium banguiense]MBP2329028.1 aspartate kinase [Kibdelosporangium banguiense]
MNLVVQKYGGTSLADASKISRAARRIAAERRSVVAVVSAMGGTTDSILGLARDLTDSPDARELDLLLSTGEQASAAALALALNELGVPARSFNGRDGGITTDGMHGCARIVNVDPVAIRECVKAGVVPVVTGFQGTAADNGELTTLCRGGSDTTAVALAAALQAEVCEIYTDVEGVFTADPRHVREARKMDYLSYGDMAELAVSGAEVLAHPSVEYASAHRVPVHVRSSASETCGTWVTSAHFDAPFESERFTAVGVAHQTGQLRCRLDGVDPDALATIAAALANPTLSVDVLNYPTGDLPSRPVPLRFIAHADQRDQVDEALAELHAARAFTGRHWSGPMGTVSLVGRGFRAHHPRVRPLVLDTLKTNRVAVRDMTVHARRISVTCAEDDVLNAVTHLHRTFLTRRAPRHRTAITPASE